MSTKIDLPQLPCSYEYLKEISSGHKNCIWLLYDEGKECSIIKKNKLNQKLNKCQ